MCRASSLRGGNPYILRHIGIIRCVGCCYGKCILPYKCTQLDDSRVRSCGGLGIGLNIVRTLVEMHGSKEPRQASHPEGAPMLYIVVWARRLVLRLTNARKKLSLTALFAGRTFRIPEPC